MMDYEYDTSTNSKKNVEKVKIFYCGSFLKEAIFQENFRLFSSS